MCFAVNHSQMATPTACPVETAPKVRQQLLCEATQQRVRNVVQLLDHICAANATSDDEKAQRMAMRRVLFSLAERTRAHKEVYLCMLSYIMRVTNHFELSYQNAPHLVLSCFILAAKFHDDFLGSVRNSYFAQVGGCTLAEVNHLERTMLSYLEWDLSVSAAEHAELEVRVDRKTYLEE
eukprot:TRINITY_DN1242_c0_g1_i3.p2 TRINITY_DN1242_c0_g1~~TRINITY_DN1242_c0_g1_i3.p2  ORF type:complete len:179 (+),score=69.97 TRINITY_DN1242_c0_g1_i3:235-771(+)